MPHKILIRSHRSSILVTILLSLIVYPAILMPPQINCSSAATLRSVSASSRHQNIAECSSSQVPSAASPKFRSFRRQRHALLSNLISHNEVSPLPDEEWTNDAVTRLIGGAGTEEKRGLLMSRTSAVVLSAAAVAAVLFVSPLPSYALDASQSAANAASVFSGLSETGFYQAFSLVFVSEIGDKTFFIAGLLAMKTSRFISYLGSMGALAAMTVLSCVIGQIFHAVPTGLAQGLPLDDVAAVAAFTFFGIKTLLEANEMEGGSVMEEELKDAEETVESSRTISEITAFGKIASTFALVFAAEFGDRSFLSTIALSAAQNPFSVCFGAVAAHGLATGIAVLGGSYVAKYVSEKVIGYIGGALFLVFALTTALGIF